MRLSNWKHPHKILVLGILIASLVCDGSFLLLPLSTAGNLAYAQRRGDGPPDKLKKGGNRPGSNQPGSKLWQDDPGRKQRPGQTAPNIRRGPDKGPQTRKAGERPDKKHRPGTTPVAPQRPPHPKNPAKPPKQPAKRHNPNVTPPRPYYGHGRPVPPRPPHIKPPVGPGPWQTTPWHGHGPSPWWLGRPFVWSLTAAATMTAIAGITYYLVNGVYYRPYAQGNTTVYVQVPPPN